MPIVTVLYFAKVRERIGLDSEQMELSATVTDRELCAEIGRRYPQVAPVLATCRVAVDQAFARGTLDLQAGSEVAIIPPVSGG